MSEVAASEPGRQDSVLRLRPGALPWRIAGALLTGAILMVALSVPAVLVPNTRVGATLAAVLVASALAARGRGWPSRAAAGAALGVALAIAVSAAAWGLLIVEPDAPVWRIVARDVVGNSMGTPLDGPLESWLNGFGQAEEHMLLVRFGASNLVLAIAGGLLGGLLASGSRTGSGDMTATAPSVADPAESERDTREQTPAATDESDEPEARASDSALPANVEKELEPCCIHRTGIS